MSNGVTEKEEGKKEEVSQQQESDLDKELKRKRSYVRVKITHYAAYFLFGGGAGLIIAFLFIKDDSTAAKDLFMAILPVASAILSFWFAGRKSGS